MKILLVEDDEAIAEVIKRGLETAYYDVDIAGDGTAGLAKAKDGSYSLVILDIMLPGMNGWAVCESLRAARSQVPILMLTARDTLEDRVRGLEIGADDYLSKPFEFPELLARVRALIRRDKVHRSRTVKVADLEIDTVRRRVIRSGKEILLTPREYELLEALAAHEGMVMSRDVIQEQVWMDLDSYSNTVDVYIAQLRKKIDAEHDVKLIRTVHRLGYMLKGPDQ
ncbi:MAG: response regulator transcription factor [Armatimonadota bacterium]|nr:response regulator transcription factor [bacterium]